MSSGGDLVPACGGTEKPFTVNGVRWLYCYQPTTHRHCYLNMDTDVAVWHRSFHPSFHPEFEFVEDDIDVPIQQIETDMECKEIPVEPVMISDMYF